MSSSRTSYATPPAVNGTVAPPPGRPQLGGLVAAAALAGLVWVQLPAADSRMAALFTLGLLLGLVLYVSAFGFTSAYRELFERRDTAGVRAQLLMLALASLLFAPVLGSGSVFGREVTGAVAPVGLQVAIGAFAFGIGMQLAGGCGSGTLYTAGGGSARMLVVLAAFCLGSFWASLHMQWWQRLPSWGEISLGEALGWPAAVAVQLVVFAVLWFALGRLARGRETASGSGPLRAIGRDWLLFGAAALALLNFLVLVTAGHPWTITWAFALWGAKAAQAVGWNPDAASFWTGEFQRSALAGGVLQDVTSLMDIGIMIGALAAAALGGRFRPQFGIAPRPLAAAVIGGLAMGYGARIAYGCNIGAFFSGVASTSLHGWLWIAAALPGNALGVKLRPWFGLSR